MTSPRMMDSATGKGVPICFGAYSMNPMTGELRKDGMPVSLPRQAMQLLLLLLEEPGRICSREELKRALWAEESYGDFDHGLNKAVYSLRAALGDFARNPRLIETLSGQGYRFIGAIRENRAELRMVRRWPEMPMAVIPFEVTEPMLAGISMEIAAQVIDELSRVAGLKVLAFSQVRGLASKEDLLRVQEQFGVRAMIVGDLRGEGEEVYLHCEMVDGADGTQMWGFNARVWRGRGDCARRVAREIVSRVKAERVREMPEGDTREQGGGSVWSRWCRRLMGGGRARLTA